MRNLILSVGLLAALVGCLTSSGGPTGSSPRTPDEAQLELLRLGIPYSDSTFVDSAGAGNLVVVQLFVQAGVSLDAREAWSDGKGFTALHAAAFGGHLEVVKYLVGQGARVNGTAWAGETVLTVLHAAAFGGHLEVVKYLVGRGANVTATDNRGRTPKDYAAFEGHTAVVEYLESVGG